jgi:alkylation response protein AidB-like acyl-CoA dehydrogenase
MCINQIRRRGNDGQFAKYLRWLVLVEQLGLLAMSEAGAGADFRSMKLCPGKAQGGYVPVGAKYRVTNAALCRRAGDVCQDGGGRAAVSPPS